MKLNLQKSCLDFQGHYITIIDEKVTHIIFGLTLFVPKKGYKDQMLATYNNGQWNFMTHRITKRGLTPPETSNNPEESLQTMYKLIKMKI